MRETAIRIIPCLDVRGGRVVKGVNFGNLVDSGDPVELSVRYEQEGADEIAMLDISATIEDRKTALATVERIRRAVGIPVLVGGGVRSVEDAGRLLKAGADRVAVNSAAVTDPELISRLADQYGVQCIVLAVDAIKKTRDNSPVTWEVVVEAGRRGTGLDAVAWATEGERRGAGEILLTSIDRDGTGLGYDDELLRHVTSACGISVIASGGAATRPQFLAGILAGARAVLAAGVFHRGELAIGGLKKYLEEQGMEVRI